MVDNEKNLEAARAARVKELRAMPIEELLLLVGTELTKQSSGPQEADGTVNFRLYFGDYLIRTYQEKLKKN